MSEKEYTMIDETAEHQVALPPSLTPDVLASLRDLASAMAREAAALIVSDRPESLGVEATKSSEVDVVTVMDQRSESLLRDRIREHRPDDAVLGEEGGASGGSSGLTWVVDPIDGTVNYLYGHPFFAVSVAVCIGETTREGAWRPVAGAVSAPLLGETFAAALGHGAYLTKANGERERLRVSACDRLGVALVGTGFGYEAAKRAAQGSMAARLLPRVRDLRRGGSAALDLCFVAAGRLDGYYESGINAWDQAAGQIIALEAGAETGGAPGGVMGKEMAVVATPKIHEALTDCLFDDSR